ncbi:DUF1622 domain-containing protein [Sphingomonas sp. SM33]|uniref:DUF1622 domain-containing protein n=1 Tax=Sphingomonas telluris TaxID=2907998 RepID=A0ABS9VP71_9SPHN|nr:DUF1622 domain-containing protein [Sphingomonas telluris]MCH8616503.1 DUF1622 domain-containing protein [Sphingomonas telluris]
METVEQIAAIVALAVELAMVAIIAIGSIRALWTVLKIIASRHMLAPAVREIWLHYAGWILLALEFALAADLIRTVIAPSWREIGQLAAIAAIRTALAWFLGRDLAEFGVETGKAEET